MMQSKKRIFAAVACIIVLLTLALGWRVLHRQSIAVVDEHVVAQLPQQAAQEQKPVLRIAVGAMISPKDTSRYYGQLVQHIGERTGYAIELVQRKTYAEINEMLLSGSIDMAFICSGPYAQVSTQQKSLLVATPQVQGSHLYYSYLIVQKDSPYQKLEDLKGTRFAFTDPDSNTGCLVPRHWLAQKGTTPAKFFSKTLFTYSHDNSIMAVTKGLVDGAAVDSLIWDYYTKISPEFTEKTRIILRSEGYGIPPVVVSPFMEDALKAQLTTVLLSLHTEDAGRHILNALLIDKFIVPQSDWYTSIRSMYSFVNALE